MILRTIYNTWKINYISCKIKVYLTFLYIFLFQIYYFWAVFVQFNLTATSVVVGIA